MAGKSHDERIKDAYDLIKSSELTLTQRNLFTNLILDKLDAFPLHDIIKNSDEGEILINGQPLDVEKATVLKESASAALNNKALALVREQVTWTSISGSLHNGDSPEKISFYRAAIWWGQQVEKHLKVLAQHELSI